MKETPLLKLKLPEPTEYVLVSDINENMEKIDTEVNKINNEITKISDPKTGVAAELTKHLDKIASTTKLGHVMVDGSTITISEDGTISGQPPVNTSGFVLTNGTRSMSNLTVGNRRPSTVIGNNSTTLGSYLEASGNNSVALNGYNFAKGISSIATGESTISSGIYSISGGVGGEAKNMGSVALGSFPNMTLSSSDSLVATATAFVIGKGTNGAPSNAFRVTFDGKVYGVGAFNSTGADYAEFFEWLDGNINNEDRVGYAVTLDGDKIRKATINDDYILGIISVNPSVIGDSQQEEWQDKYVTDQWGRIQYHYVDVEYNETSNVIDENGSHDKAVTKVRQDYVPVLNPQWNNNEEYIPREQRKEWDAVGLMGKLYVRDDGTCMVNNYAKVGQIEGELSASEVPTNMRVIERVSENIVRVFIK